MCLVCMHDSVINHLYQGSAHVRAIMHSLTLVHYRTNHGIAKSYHIFMHVDYLCGDWQDGRGLITSVGRAPDLQAGGRWVRVLHR